MPDALRDGLEDRDPLGAQRQAVGRILDVAARHDLAVARAERRPPLELRVRRVRPLPRRAGQPSQLPQAGRLAAFHARFAASWMMRPRTSIRRALTLSPTSSTS